MDKRTETANILIEVEQRLSRSTDYRTKKIMIGSGFTAELVFSDVLLEKEMLSDQVLKPLLQERVFRECGSVSEIEYALNNGATYLTSCKAVNTADEVIEAFLGCCAALFIEGARSVYVFEANTTSVRQVSEPSNETVMNGARDSFVETLNINLTLIRSHLKTPELVLEGITVGSEIKTRAAVVYVDGIADTKKVEMIKKMLTDDQIKKVMSVGTVIEALTGRERSVFPQTMTTERADILCSDISQGYIGIIVDGFPIAVVTPVTLLTLIQAHQDYSENTVVASLIRIMRLGMVFIALAAPAVYISVMSFHHEMMPTKLAVSIIQARLEVPFVESFETVLMLILFEVLIEASLRIPKNIGQTVSIVGGIVIGDAAVSAKIISPFVIIIVALASIASFTIPDQDLSNAVRLWRIILTLLSSVLGLFGFIVGFIVLTLQLCSIETLGVPFMAPYISEDVFTKDTFLRLAFAKNKKPPQYLSKEGGNNE